MKGVAWAPGKAIISGEHFVVHGATALAAAIERGVRVEATRGSRLSISSALREPQAVKPVKSVVRSLYKARGKDPGVSISITSTLPEGAGLGSSAATMVAVASAVSSLEGWGLDPRALSEAGGAGERMVHGNPSGIDAETSAMGGVILFKRGEAARRVVLDSPFAFLVVHSGRKRSTGRLISRVTEMKQTYPSLFEGLCESATLVSGLCAQALRAHDSATLGQLMTYSHAVLSRAGASTKGLDELVDLCISSGCLGAKLTGAGGGGSVLAVPPVDPGKTTGLLSSLAEKGYQAFLTSVPTTGVKGWTE